MISNSQTLIEVGYKLIPYVNVSQSLIEVGYTVTNDNATKVSQSLIEVGYTVDVSYRRRIIIT